MDFRFPISDSPAATVSQTLRAGFRFEERLRRRAFLRVACLAMPGLSLVACGDEAKAAAKPKLKILPRSDWSDVRPRLPRLRKASRFTRLTVHHTGGPVCRTTDKNAVMFKLSNLQAGHLNRNYGDIAYHYLIDYPGRIWEGRSLKYEGAHVSSHNPGNIGVMVLGNFEQQYASKEQVASLGRLVALLQGRYKINRGRIFGHRDLGQSACPGRHLYPYVTKLRA